MLLIQLVFDGIFYRYYYFLVLSVRSVAAPTESVVGFDDMVSGTERKYYMLGGKGGVGKTSCATSLAVKFANNGHPTLVSTDPAHSLSDSFAQVNHMPSSSDVAYVLDLQGLVVCVLSVV